MGTPNNANKDSTGPWYVDDSAKPELLERILDKATSPSLLIKITDSAEHGQTLKSLQASGWSVIATKSEKTYETLAHQGGLDFVLSDAPKDTITAPMGTEVLSGRILQESASEIIHHLDREFLHKIHPKIVFIGGKKAYNSFQGAILDISKDMYDEMRNGMPDDNTDLVVCDSRRMSNSAIARELRKKDLPVVYIHDVITGDEFIKSTDLDDVAVSQSTIRGVIAAFNKRDVSRSRKIVYIQGTGDDRMYDFLKQQGHRAGLIPRERFIKLANSDIGKKTAELAFLRKADAVVGELSEEYLKFTQAVHKKMDVTARFCAFTPYERNVDKLRSLLFLLYGGFAFLPEQHKSWDMLRIILRNIHRQPRLPLRVLYQRIEGKKLTKLCEKAERDLLSEEVPGIHRGISSLFEAVNTARTGLPAATLAYGMYSLRQLSKKSAVITQSTIDHFAKLVQDNYDNLRRRISPQEVPKIAAESFKQTPGKEITQNLRQSVFRISYPPDYDFFHKVRPAEEAKRYLKVYDYFSRLNRLHKSVRPGLRKLDIDWSIPEKPYDVGLGELFVFHKLQDDKYLLTEVEEYQSYKDLLQFLRENKDNKDIIIDTFENAVRQAARMASQGPLLAAEEVKDLNSFWSSRFKTRLQEPIGDGLSRLFENTIPAEDFRRLENSLNAVYRHLANENLVRGFYSDRWPGNMGSRKNKKIYNFGFRLCYNLPAVIEAVTVFQHTDYLPGNTVDEKINSEKKFFRIFFEEYNNAACTFNNQILPKYGAGLRDFIIAEIDKDIEAFKDLKLQVRAADKPIKDPIHMSISQRESLTSILLYPSHKTLSQMKTSIMQLQPDAAPDDIYKTLQAYVVDVSPAIPKMARKVDNLERSIKKHLKQDAKTLSRVREVIKSLPKDADVNEAREALFNELCEKPQHYIDLLQNFAANMKPRQSLYENEGRNRGQFEQAVNEKYIPACYVAMMERGLIAAAALVKKVSDLKIYTRCVQGHPFDDKHMQECLEKLDLAKMAVTNSLRAAHYCQRHFVEKNPELASVAIEIERFDKVLYERILTGIGKAQGIYETTRKSAP